MLLFLVGIDPDLDVKHIYRISYTKEKEKHRGFMK
jgi:hypothetical protein